MSNSYFNFKQFRVEQGDSAFRVGTDSVLLGAWAKCQGASEILDVGTGTGLLALMLAQRSESSITAIEPDFLSYREADKNIKNSPWSDRITLINASLQEFSSEAKRKYDLIITNPPYFGSSLRNSNARSSAARHNINLNTDEILLAASALLEESGILSMILPYVEGNMFIAAAASYGFYCNRMTRVKPLPAKSVKRLLIEFSREKEMLVSDYLSVERGERHEYSAEYIELTRDFYLDF